MLQNLNARLAQSNSWHKLVQLLGTRILCDGYQIVSPSLESVECS